MTEPKDNQPNRKTRSRGSVRQVTPGRFRIRVCVGKNDVTGKPEYFDKTISGTSKEANRMLSGVVRDLDLGTYTPMQRTSLAEWFADWLRTQRTRVEARTADGYQALYDRYLAEALGKLSLANLKPLDIQSVYTGMSERGLSPTVIRHTHVVLKGALKRAVQMGLLQRNPADPVEVPKLTHKERRVLSPEEAIRFIKACQTQPRGLIFEFALATGMRPEEYLALQWSDVDLEKGLATIQRVLVIHKGKVSFEKPKTAKSRRSVPFPLALSIRLREHRLAQNQHRLLLGREWKAHDLIFCSEIGTPLQIPTLTYRYYRPLLAAAKLPVIRLYDLRHSQATILLMMGENPKVVSERLGHSTTRLTMDVYSHVLPTMQQQASDRLGNVLYGEAPATGQVLSHKFGKSL